MKPPLRKDAVASWIAQMQSNADFDISAPEVSWVRFPTFEIEEATTAREDMLSAATESPLTNPLPFHRCVLILQAPTKANVPLIIIAEDYVEARKWWMIGFLFGAWRHLGTASRAHASEDHPLMIDRQLPKSDFVLKHREFVVELFNNATGKAFILLGLLAMSGRRSEFRGASRQLAAINLAIPSDCQIPRTIIVRRLSDFSVSGLSPKAPHKKIPHERRTHFRTLRSGRRITVSSCSINGGSSARVAYVVQ